MSAERDELAKRDELIELVLPILEKCFDSDWNMTYSEMVTDAILAAGFTKPRQVTTVAELDALPNGTVVMDSEGEVARKLTYGWRVLVAESGFDAWLSDPLEETYLPATVLYSPVVDS